MKARTKLFGQIGFTVVLSAIVAAVAWMVPFGERKSKEGKK